MRLASDYAEFNATGEEDRFSVFLLSKYANESSDGMDTCDVKQQCREVGPHARHFATGLLTQRQPDCDEVARGESSEAKEVPFRIIQALATFNENLNIAWESMQFATDTITPDVDNRVSQLTATKLNDAYFKKKQAELQLILHCILFGTLVLAPLVGPAASGAATAAEVALTAAAETAINTAASVVAGAYAG